MIKIILIALFLVVNCQQQHQLRPRHQWTQGCLARTTSELPISRNVNGFFFSPRRGLTVCISVNLGQRHFPLDNTQAPENNANVHISIAHSFPVGTSLSIFIQPNGGAVWAGLDLQTSMRVTNTVIRTTFDQALLLITNPFVFHVGLKDVIMNQAGIISGGIQLQFTSENFGTTSKDIIKGPIVYNQANTFTDVKARNWDPTYVNTFTPLQDFVLLDFMGLDHQSWTSIAATVVKVSDAITDIKESDTVFVDFADCISNLYEVEPDATAVYSSLTTSNYCTVRRGSILGVNGAPSRHIRQPNPFGAESSFGWF